MIPKTWVPILALPLSSCVILGKSLNLSGAQLPLLRNGDDNRHFSGLLHGLSE